VEWVDLVIHLTIGPDRLGGALLEKSEGDNEVKRILERVSDHLTNDPFAPSRVVTNGSVVSI
jgi:hypothetical protein